MLKSLQLLSYISGLAKAGCGSIQPGILAGRKGSYRIARYLSGKKKSPAILLLNGMNIRGIDDPRIIDIAKAFCAAGFDVITGEIDDIKKLKIEISTIEKIAELISLVQDSQDGDDISFLSVSFSGGLGLVAMEQMDNCRIGNVMLLGTYADFASTIPYVVRNYDRDNYGASVFFYNYINRVFPDSSLPEVFYAQAVDNSLKRYESNSVKAGMVSALGSKDREIFDKLDNSGDYRREIVREILDVSENDEIRQLSPVYQMKYSSTRFALVHGNDDPVISPSESIALSERMNFLGIDNRLEITGMFSHGDKKSIIKELPEIPGMIKIFSYFMEKIDFS